MLLKVLRRVQVTLDLQNSVEYVTIILGKHVKRVLATVYTKCPGRVILE